MSWATTITERLFGGARPLWILTALLVMSVAVPIPSARAKGGTLIAYVNLQRAILEVEEGKRAKAALKVTFEKKQKALQAKEAELMRMKQALEQQAAVQSDADTRAKALEFQNKLMELQQTFMQEQKELQNLEQKELAGITEKMRKIIDQIGKQGQYSLILEIQDSRLLYAQPHLDLTNEVIRKYNARHK